MGAWRRRGGGLGCAPAQASPYAGDVTATRTKPRLAPGNCSVTWDGASDPAWGTASPATFWVAMEQRGPWGHKAITQSRLDPVVGARLEQGTLAAGGRALLIRDASRERHSAVDGYPRRVYVSGGMTAGTPWLLTGEHTDAAEIASLPFDAIAAGDQEAVRSAAPWLSPASDGPVALVCTNSKRDVCCALRGRPLVGALTERLPGRVWQCSHTGGHRFAPTGLVLPHGLSFARASEPDLLVEALHTLRGGSAPAALLTARHLRGLAHLPAVQQAADGYVRATYGVTDLTALTVCDEEPDERGAHMARADTASERNHFVRVDHRDGRYWCLRVTERDTATRPVSCGGALVDATAYHVTALPDR